MRHKTDIMENGKPKLHLINKCSSRYDILFCVLLFPDGGKGWNYNVRAIQTKRQPFNYATNIFYKRGNIV